MTTNRTPADIEARCPYTDADVEPISVTDLREGDLVVERGPQGSGRYAATRVVEIHRAGHDDFWSCDVWEFRLDGMPWDQFYRQPVRLKVGIVRRDLQAR